MVSKILEKHALCKDRMWSNNILSRNDGGPVKFKVLNGDFRKKIENPIDERMTSWAPSILQRYSEAPGTFKIVSEGYNIHIQ